MKKYLSFAAFAILFPMMVFSQNQTIKKSKVTTSKTAQKPKQAGPKQQSAQQQSKTTNSPCPDNHHPHAIDLGAAGVWACCNVGASRPENYGYYFAWGETSPKSDYSWDTYKWGKDYGELTKYCNFAAYGKNGFTDDKNTLDFSDDAAYANWGSNWRMPTSSEVEILINNTNSEWVENYNGTGVKGYKFTNKNDPLKYIFLPAAGFRDGTSYNDVGSGGFYCSSSLGFRTFLTYYLFFYQYDVCLDASDGRRYYGRSVRPIQQ